MNTTATVVTKTNLPGSIGFWLAIAGFITCGVTGIPSLVLSSLGAREEPRGMAIAGVFLSMPSVAWSGFWILSWSLAIFPPEVVAHGFGGIPGLLVALGSVHR